jgi:hypothetical protein
MRRAGHMVNIQGKHMDRCLSAPVREEYPYTVDSNSEWLLSIREKREENPYTVDSDSEVVTVYPRVTGGVPRARQRFDYCCIFRESASVPRDCASDVM